MHVNKKYFSIIITSNFNEKVRNYKLSWLKVQFLLAIIIFLACGAVALIFIYGSIAYKNIKIMMLTKENNELKNKVEKILIYEKEFDDLNKNVTKLANMLGVKTISNPTDMIVRFDPKGSFPSQKGGVKNYLSPYLYPVKGYITQKFSPIHTGIDIAANYGDSVISTIDGIVESVEYDSILGNVLKINNNEGFKIVYGHLSKIKVQKGEKVSQGTLVGFVGSTGKSAGPHLHYEIWKDGIPQNPEEYLRR